MEHSDSSKTYIKKAGMS